MVIGLISDFFAWWYSEGFKKIFLFLAALFSYLDNLFSIGTITKTLFHPWRRLVGPRGKGLIGFRDWILDNLVSRTLGFIMRLFLIVIFVVSAVVLGVFALLLLLFWGFVPMLFIGLIIWMFK